MRLRTLGSLPAAGTCWYRIVRLPDTGGTVIHDEAPQGISGCRICRRVVYRGMGRWWL